MLQVVSTGVYYPPVDTTWKILTTGASQLTAGALCNGVELFYASGEVHLKKITSPGEGMVGLKDLHKLTSGGKYSLRFDFRDENSKCLVAVYDQIEVIFRIWNMSVHC